MSTVRSLGLTIGVALSSTVAVTTADGSSTADLTFGIVAVAVLAGVVTLVGLALVLVVAPRASDRAAAHKVQA